MLPEATFCFDFFLSRGIMDCNVATESAKWSLQEKTMQTTAGFSL